MLFKVGHTHQLKGTSLFFHPQERWSTRVCNDTHTRISTLSVHSLRSELHTSYNSYIGILHMSIKYRIAMLPSVKTKYTHKGTCIQTGNSTIWVEQINSLPSTDTCIKTICKTNARINVPYSGYATNPIRIQLTKHGLPIYFFDIKLCIVNPYTICMYTH